MSLNLWRASKWHPKSYISNLLVCTKRALKSNRFWWSHEPRKKKKKTYFPLYWLFNRGPYNGLNYNPHLTGQYNTLFSPTNQGPFFRGSHGLHQFGGFHRMRPSFQRPGHVVSWAWNWKVFPLRFSTVFGQSNFGGVENIAKLKRYILTFWKAVKFHESLSFLCTSLPFTKCHIKSEKKIWIQCHCLWLNSPVVNRSTQRLVTFWTSRTGTTLEWILAKMSTTVPEKICQGKEWHIEETIFTVDCIFVPIEWQIIKQNGNSQTAFNLAHSLGKIWLMNPKIIDCVARSLHLLHPFHQCHPFAFWEPFWHDEWKASYNPSVPSHMGPSWRKRCSLRNHLTLLVHLALLGGSFATKNPLKVPLEFERIPTTQRCQREKISLSHFSFPDSRDHIWHLQVDFDSLSGEGNKPCY